MRLSAANRARPCSAVVTPMSATCAARSWKTARSCSARPNSFTSSAPDTLKRSVIVEFIAALSCMLCRDRPCRRRPTIRAGTMNSGSSATASSVTRHSSRNIAERVTDTLMTLSTIPPSVPVRARWAPTTLLFSRVMSAPVWVRVKKASGMACTCSNSIVRRSRMSPSPMEEDSHRSIMVMIDTAIATPAIPAKSSPSSPVSPSGMARLMTMRTSCGGAAESTALTTMTDRNPISRRR